MSKGDFLRCLRDFHGPEIFAELKNVKLFNKKVDLYGFYESAKSRGGSIDSVIITQWRDICIEMGLLDSEEEITLQDAYKASRFFCYCFIDFTYPKPGKIQKKRFNKKGKRKLPTNYHKIHHGLLSGQSSRLTGEYGLMDDRPRGAGNRVGVDNDDHYDNLVWMAKNAMNVPKYKFFSNKNSEDCTIFENQWVLPSHDSSVPLSYRIQSKVACAAKRAAENSELKSQSSDELLTRSSCSDDELVLSEYEVSDAELDGDHRLDYSDGNDWGIGGANSIDFNNRVRSPIDSDETERNYGFNNYSATPGSVGGIPSGFTRYSGKSKSGTRKKDLVRDIIHEVAKYLMSGYEIETCLTIILKSLTVVKLPKIPGLCRHITYINIQLSKELIKYGDFIVQREILNVLDVLCNILSLILRDSFLEFVKHKYNTTYQQSMLCLEALQVTSCILFLKINEAFQKNKFKHNDFALDPDADDIYLQDGVEGCKTHGNKNDDSNSIISSDKSSTHSDRSGAYNSQERSTADTIHSQLYNRIVASVQKKTVESEELNDTNVDSTGIMHTVHKYFKTNDSGNPVIVDDAEAKESIDGSKDESDQKRKKKYPSILKIVKSKLVDDRSESINHLEILSNMFILIKYLSVISNELWQYDMICTFIDPFLELVFNEIVDNKAPGYWLWDDFQEALCTLFSSCYYLSQKMEGKMQIGTVVNLYRISASLLTEPSISKILFRKIVQMILSFHIYVDFQMFNFMNCFIKGICEILVQIIISSIKNNYEQSSEVKAAPRKNDSRFYRDSECRFESYIRKISAKTPNMNELFLNIDNPIVNPWASVPRDYSNFKSGHREVSESSDGDNDDIIDYVMVNEDKDGDNFSSASSFASDDGQFSVGKEYALKGSNKGHKKDLKTSKKGNTERVESWKKRKKNLDNSFLNESVPRKNDLTLEESIRYLQGYYRKVLGITPKTGDSLDSSSVESDTSREVCDRITLREDPFDKMHGSSFGPAYNHSHSCRERFSCSKPNDQNCHENGKHSDRLGRGNRLPVKEEPALIDQKVFESFKGFENTREIVCLCIAKMTEYSFCLDIIKCNYNKILECAYNDYSARFFWPVIHKLQLDESFETEYRGYDAGLVFIDRIK